MRIFNLLILLVLLSSCNSWVSKAMKESREPNVGNFVETKDSTYLTKDFKYSKGNYILDNGEKISYEAVIAYQSKEGYFKKIDVYPYGFFKRTLRGRINYYSTTYVSGTTTTRTKDGFSSIQNIYTVVALVQKDGGELVSFNNSNLRGIVLDYKPALDVLDLQEKNIKKYKKIGRINTLVGIGGVILSIIIVPDKEVAFHQAVGLTAFLGALGSGVYNRIRKNKNDNSLWDCMLVYNKGNPVTQ